MATARVEAATVSARKRERGGSLGGAVADAPTISGGGGREGGGGGGAGVPPGSSSAPGEQPQVGRRRIRTKGSVEAAT